MNQSLLTTVLLATVLVSGGCASGQSGSTNERSQARGAQAQRAGVVDAVRDVQIEGSRSGPGALAGGAVIGAIAGSAAGQGEARRPGLEITVRVDDGSRLAIVQEADERFTAGDKVRILSDQGVSRVTH